MDSNERPEHVYASPESAEPAPGTPVSVVEKRDILDWANAPDIDSGLYEDNAINEIFAYAGLAEDDVIFLAHKVREPGKFEPAEQERIETLKAKLLAYLSRGSIF